MSVTAEHFDPSHKDKYHQFLLPSPEYCFDPVESMVTLREAIDSFPETKATFRQKTVWDDDHVHIPSHFWVRALILVDSWRVPETFANTTAGSARYVNPKHPHRSRYSDTAVHCDCGEILIKFDEPMEPVTNHYLASNRHTDDCLKEWGLQTRATLWKNRRLVLNQGIWLGHSAQSIAARLDYNRKSTHKITSKLGMDVPTLVDRARARIGRTINLLRERYMLKTIAKAYGMPVSTTSYYSNKYPTDDSLETVLTERHPREFTVSGAKA